MRKRFTTAGAGLVALLLILQVAPLHAAGDPGDAGLLFLRLGMGTREAAMGGGAVASATGAAAAYWNPSRAAFAAPSTSVLLQQQSWLGMFDYTAASMLHTSDIGVIGLSFSGFFPDRIVRYSEDNVGHPEGTFSSHDVAFAASYSRRVLENVAVGVQGKVVHERIDIYSGTVVLADVFLTLRSSQLQGLYFAASATNLGGQMTINETPFDAPRTLTAGVAYTPQTTLLADRLTVAADLASFNDGNQKMHTGVEFNVVPELALRLGYRVNYENQGLTAGLGVEFPEFALGYAYEDISESALDPGHRFSLELFF